MPQAAIQSSDGGLQIEYEQHGSNTGEWIVLIRGLGTQMIEWSPVFIQALIDAGLRVLTFDNRDAGLSEKMKADYDVTDMASDVIGLMDTLHIPSAHIFGVSMGRHDCPTRGPRYPERVDTLFSVMSSSGAEGLPKASPEVWEWMSIDADTREDYIRLDAQSRVVFGSPGYPESEAHRVKLATQAYDRCFFPEGVARQMRAITANRNRVAKLQAISVPTLVIHGADDALLPPAHGADTARHIAGAGYELVPGMGHNIPDALAPVIAERVIDFVGESKVPG